MAVIVVYVVFVSSTLAVANVRFVWVALIWRKLVETVRLALLRLRYCSMTNSVLTCSLALDPSLSFCDWYGAAFGPLLGHDILLNTERGSDASHSRRRQS